MGKKFLLAAAAALALAVAAPAQADTVLFNPDGTGDAGTFIEIDGFDWAVGNGIAVGANAESEVGDDFTFYYQANLADAVSSEFGSVFDNGTDGNYFTVVMGFGETVTGSTVVDGIGTLQFDFDPDNPINFFQIYANDAPASNLTGVCFTCGTLVLEGDVTNIFDDYLSSFSTTATSGGALDQAGSDNWEPVQTIRGSGETDLTVAVTYVNPDYLRGLNEGDEIVFATADANASLPYNTADPSACFHATSISGFTGDDDLVYDCVGGVTEGVSTVGLVNGLGSNTMLEVDGNSSFTTERVNVVPEPATLTLLGLGLLGGAAARRRQQRKNQD